MDTYFNMSQKLGAVRIMGSNSPAAGSGALSTTGAGVAVPVVRNAVRSTAPSTRMLAHQLTWVVGLLGIILLGQANEFSSAYLNNGRVFSPIAFGLSLIAASYALRYLKRPAIGLPAGLLITTIMYTLVVGAVVSAPTVALAESWPEMSKLLRALLTFCCMFLGLQALARLGALGGTVNLFTCVAAIVVCFQVGSFLLGHQPSIRPDATDESSFRYSGIFGDPNQAAGFSVLLLCITLLSGFPRWAKLALSALSLGGVLVTFSRGGILTFIAVASCNVFVGRHSARVGFAIAAVLSGALVFLAIPHIVDSGLLSFQAARHVMQLHDLLTGKADITDNSRGQLLWQAMTAIEAHPWFGYGLQPHYSVLGTGAHNMYTHLALFAGLPVMLVYILSLISLGIYGLSRSSVPERQFVVSLAVWIAVMGLSLHSLFAEKYTLTFLALACAISATHVRPSTTLLDRSSLSSRVERVRSPRCSYNTRSGRSTRR